MDSKVIPKTKYLDLIFDTGVRVRVRVYLALPVPVQSAGTSTRMRKDQHILAK